ncbi:hypothetical protein WSK_1626 [Novosphingobium sp. Rr 2-17]|uniref:hypothetical protein n=1 Tax=Novosphingobium sp. Rr 2-17 TaxID=555793 RepID=UPI0002699B9A|nr:hypothetical protein [Novosphingobium sp. Rr 2-17]EIZ79736.1 hypothetical protein WSK_1626 [Novosphingobium sp. Rr 2-17]
MPHSFILQDRLSRLRSGQRWWPAEAAFRAAGLLSLWSAWQLALLAHRMEAVTAPTASFHHHLARLADLGVCTGVVLLLSGGLLLSIEGAGLLRDVPLPRYFTQPKGPCA